MIEYIALHLLNISFLINRGTTYEKKFLYAFLVFNAMILFFLILLMRALRYLKKKIQPKKKPSIELINH